jgi:peroxiredoxin Q/BCP
MGILEKIVKDKSVTPIKEGEMAPDFSGADQYGKKVSLNDFKGKRLALYFYPKDDTLGCTAEACNLRDNYHGLKKHDIEIIGISADDEASHKEFSNKLNLPFRLIADTDKKIIHAYGVWGKKTLLGKPFNGILRTTFMIDKAGKIEKIISKVETGDHSKQILTALGLS